MAVDFYFKLLIQIEDVCILVILTTISTIRFQSSYEEMEISVEYSIEMICFFFVSIFSLLWTQRMVWRFMELVDTWWLGCFIAKQYQNITFGSPAPSLL